MRSGLVTISANHLPWRIASPKVTITLNQKPAKWLNLGLYKLHTVQNIEQLGIEEIIMNPFTSYMMGDFVHPRIYIISLDFPWKQRDFSTEQLPAASRWAVHGGNVAETSVSGKHLVGLLCAAMFVKKRQNILIVSWCILWMACQSCWKIREW